jgi:prevent-host-death family protein
MDHLGKRDVKAVTGREAKQSFGQLIADAQREPVRIERYGRTVAVVVSPDEYERLAACKEFVRAQAAKGAIDPGEEVQGVLKDDERREAEAELEALLLEGLHSGPATPLSAEDWAAVDRNLEEHIARRRHREPA